MSTFLCCMLNARHCSEIHLYEKMIQCKTLECVTIGSVHAPCSNRDLSSCSLVPQAVRFFVNILLCNVLLRKNVSDLAGIRSFVVFYLPYFEEL